jgi:hypothetical protein
MTALALHTFKVICVVIAWALAPGLEAVEEHLTVSVSVSISVA